MPGSGSRATGGAGRRARRVRVHLDDSRGGSGGRHGRLRLPGRQVLDRLRRAQEAGASPSRPAPVRGDIAVSGGTGSWRQSPGLATTCADTPTFLRRHVCGRPRGGWAAMYFACTAVHFSCASDVPAYAAVVLNIFRRIYCGVGDLCSLYCATRAGICSHFAERRPRSRVAQPPDRRGPSQWPVARQHPAG